MALTQAKLSSELQNLTPTVSAAEGTLAQAYGDYLKDAVTGGVPAEAAAIDSTAVPAMAGAMAFSSSLTATQAAAQFSAGLSAFWAAMVAAPAAFFPGSSLITPAIFTALPGLLAPVFTANTSNNRSLSESMDAIAAVIHPLSAGIGTATFGPTTFPIL